MCIFFNLTIRFDLVSWGPDLVQECSIQNQHLVQKSILGSVHRGADFRICSNQLCAKKGITEKGGMKSVLGVDSIMLFLDI